jgi:hypothetical protein
MTTPWLMLGSPVIVLGVLLDCMGFTWTQWSILPCPFIGVIIISLIDTIVELIVTIIISVHIYNVSVVIIIVIAWWTSSFKFNNCCLKSYDSFFVSLELLWIPGVVH